MVITRTLATKETQVMEAGKYGELGPLRRLRRELCASWSQALVPSAKAEEFIQSWKEAYLKAGVQRLYVYI